MEQIESAAGDIAVVYSSAPRGANVTACISNDVMPLNM
jgi:hypothetical protein